MALRLIELVLDEKGCKEAQDCIKNCELIENRQIDLPGGKALIRILLDAEQNEPVLDSLEELCSREEENRMLILSVEATLPRVEETSKSKPLSDRIAREELYEDIKDSGRCKRSFLIMVGLSTIVASVGLYYNSIAILIGAMVIAPLMGPCIALSLATTLGDLPLLWRALVSICVGTLFSATLGVVFGFTIDLDPGAIEAMLRTRIEIGDIAVALASGCAGALAFTTGVSAILIGVMVAVALLPSLVAFGLLLGSLQPELAMSALSLFLLNLVCINLAGVMTFLLQGVRPSSWWEKDRAIKATVTSISLWVFFLGAVVTLILFR